MRRTILLAVAILAATGVSPVVLNFEYQNLNNFCRAENRYLGNQALIDAAIAYAIDQIRPEDVARGAIKYKSVEEFHRLNPICCRLQKRITPRYWVWVRRLVGSYFIPVDLWWRYTSEGDTPFIAVHYLIDPCGRIRSGPRLGEPYIEHAATKKWEDAR